MSILEELERAGRFGAFLATVKIAGMDRLLSREGEYTLFAPTDTAFRKLSGKRLDALLACRENLVNFIVFHFLPSKITTQDIKDFHPRGRLAGKRFKIKKNKVSINDAKITAPDIECANGVVHGINTILKPDKVRQI